MGEAGVTFALSFAAFAEKETLSRSPYLLLNAACAAARRAIGTRYGEQET